MLESVSLLLPKLEPSRLWSQQKKKWLLVKKTREMGKTKKNKEREEMIFKWEKVIRK